MNRLLLAMSVLPNNLTESSFAVPFSGKEYVVEKCIGQLEPVTKYMLDALEGELSVIILATKDTYTKPKDIDGIEYTALSYYVARMCEHIGVDFDVNSFTKDNIRFDQDYKFGRLTIRVISIEEEQPKAGIENVVAYLRDNDDKEKDNLWIDTHGGFRDVSLALNAIVSLLEVYDIKPSKIVGVRHANREDKLSVNKIVDQKESYDMFKFVSGMNEFIQFGSARTLVELFKDTKDKSIRTLLAAMNTISLGTRLCDPKLYIEGLNDLGNIIDSVKTKDEFITIFIDYIKQDYGLLLDKEKRTTLDIVKRCYRKNLYQQALTFIESLMPEEFFEKKALYAASCDKEIIEKLQEKVNKAYLSWKHFAIDQYLYGLKPYYINQDVDWNSVKKNYPEGSKASDYWAIQAINTKSKELFSLFINDSEMVDVTLNGKVGYLTVYSDLKPEYKDDMGKLLRLHKAIKTCRNLTNHASDKMRPSVEDINVGLEQYIELADRILNEDSIKPRNEITAVASKVYKKRQNNHNDGNANSNKKKTNIDNKKNKIDLSKITIDEGYICITRLSSNKISLRGVDSQKRECVISKKYLSDIKDTKLLIGKKIPVTYVFENIKQKIWECKPNVDLKSIIENGD